MGKPQADKQTEVKFRSDDCSVVFLTHAYVSHRRGNGAWPSSFSVNIDEAKRIHSQLGELLEEVSNE